MAHITPNELVPYSNLQGTRDALSNTLPNGVIRIINEYSGNIVYLKVNIAPQLHNSIFDHIATWLNKHALQESLSNNDMQKVVHILESGHYEIEDLEKLHFEILKKRGKEILALLKEAHIFEEVRKCSKCGSLTDMLKDEAHLSKDHKLDQKTIEKIKKLADHSIAENFLLAQLNYHLKVSYDIDQAHHHFLFYSDFSNFSI